MIRSALVGGKLSVGATRRTPLWHSSTKRTSLQTRLGRRSLHPLHAKRGTSSKAPPLANPDTEITEQSAENVVGEVAAGDEQQQQQVPYTSPQQVYYESLPAGPPSYPFQPPPPVVEASTGLPPWVWIMVGILLGTVFNKVMSFVSRPKEAMTEMMMQQMMNQMAAGNKGAAPFGNPMQPPSPFGMGMPPTTPPPPTPAYDTTAMPSAAPTAPAGSQQTVTPDPQKNGVKTPEVKTEAAPFTAPQAPPSQPSFFQDVSATNEAPPKATETMTPEESDEAVDFMFEMLKNPQMRDSLYQFLPENMRSPEMLDTVMSSPMVKEQFKSMMTPELLQQIKGFRNQANNPEMQSQMEAMNISPDVLMQKLMNEPEVVAMMQKPNVMQAVMDLQQNPTNMSKYVNDPEVMQFMMKMNELTLQAQTQSQQQQQQSPPPPPPAPEATVTPPPASTPSPASEEVQPEPAPAGSPSQAESDSS